MALSQIPNHTFIAQDNTIIAASLSPDAAVLSFSGIAIGCDGARAVAGLLAKSTALHSLALDRCDIGIDGVIALCASLPSSRSIATLDLSSLRQSMNSACGLGQEALHHIGGAVKACSSLRQLSLRKCPHLTHIGLSPLLEGLHSSRVHTLDLSRNTLGPPAGLLLATALMQGLGLRTLVLAYCPLGDEGAVALARVCASGRSNLQSLDVRGCGIGDEGIIAFAKSLASEQCSLNILKIWGNAGLHLLPTGRPGIEAIAAWQEGAAASALRTAVDVKTYRVDGVAHAAEISLEA